MVTWSKDGSPLREEDLPARIRITMAREGDMFQSGLEIDAVELSDTADYACNVSNPVGSAYRFKRLEVQGLYGTIAVRGLSYFSFPLPLTRVPMLT